MPSNPTYLRDRMLEATTVARAGDLVAQLNALVIEESSKRYAATRPQRRQLALDLVNVAQTIVDRLAEAPVQRKRTAKPVVAKPEEAAAATAVAS